MSTAGPTVQQGQLSAELEQMVDSIAVVMPDIPELAVFLRRVLPAYLAADYILISAVVYFDRLTAQPVCPPELKRQPIHCLLTSLILALKFWHDKVHSNAFYARTAGVTLQELNAWERAALQAIDYNLDIDDAQYQLYKMNLSGSPATSMVDPASSAASAEHCEYVAQLSIYLGADENRDAAELAAEYPIIQDDSVAVDPSGNKFHNEKIQQPADFLAEMQLHNPVDRQLKDKLLTTRVSSKEVLQWSTGYSNSTQTICRTLVSCFSALTLGFGLTKAPPPSFGSRQGCARLVRRASEAAVQSRRISSELCNFVQL